MRKGTSVTTPFEGKILDAGDGDTSVQSLPVLMYHSVTPTGDLLSVTPGLRESGSQEFLD